MSAKEIEIADLPGPIALKLRAVGDGEPCILTDQGKPFAEIRAMATITPVVSDDPEQRKREILERFRQLREGNRLDGLTLKELREEGRR